MSCGGNCNNSALFAINIVIVRWTGLGWAIVHLIFLFSRSAREANNINIHQKIRISIKLQIDLRLFH